MSYMRLNRKLIVSRVDLRSYHTMGHCFKTTEQNMGRGFSKILNNMGLVVVCNIKR